MPIAGKMYFVFHESMYSALPTKLMLRGTVSIRNAESRNEMWFGHRIAGPSVGQPLVARHVDVPEPAGDRAEHAPRALAAPSRLRWLSGHGPSIVGLFVLQEFARQVSGV